MKKTEKRCYLFEIDNIPEDIPLNAIPKDINFDKDSSIISVISPTKGCYNFEPDYIRCEDVVPPAEAEPEVVEAEEYVPCDGNCDECVDRVPYTPCKDLVAQLTQGLFTNIANGAAYVYGVIEPEDKGGMLLYDKANRAVAADVSNLMEGGFYEDAVNNLLSHVTQMIFLNGNLNKKKLYSVIGHDK